MKSGSFSEKLKGADSVKTLLSVVFVALVFIPLFRMFMNIDADSFKRVINSPVFGQAIANSLLSALIGTTITVILAFILAICIQRTNIHLKGVFGVLFTLPMLIPSISSGMGLVILFGNNGVLTKLFTAFLAVIMAKSSILV